VKLIFDTATLAVQSDAAANAEILDDAVKTGAILSITVTTALHVETFPDASVAVNVTIFGPMSEQVNVVLEALKLKLQLSDDPLLISAVVIDAVPEAFKYTVAGLQSTTGAMLSTTVTVVLQVAVLPEASVTVNTTVLAPLFVQSKLDLDALNEKVQLSDEPLLISAVVIDAVPEAFKYTVAGLQSATGAMLSTTVTVVLQVAVLPEASVTVNITVLAPLFVQSKLVLDALNVNVQLSDDPLLMSAVVIDADPNASR
jgi:hypothetical protein